MKYEMFLFQAKKRRAYTNSAEKATTIFWYKTTTYDCNGCITARDYGTKKISLQPAPLCDCARLR